MQCPKCNTELKINWITKEAECISCHQHYHLRFRKVNVLAWFACVVIFAVVLSHIMALVSAGNQLVLVLLLILFNLGVYFFLPRELQNKFLYKLCIEDRSNDCV